MNKSYRNYVLEVSSVANNKTITITPPFTLEIDIKRNLLGAANDAVIRIFNLNEEHRNQLFYTFFEESNRKNLLLKAGYGVDTRNFPIIFRGSLNQGFSVREGTTFVTELHAFDGGWAFQASEVSKSFSENFQNKAMIQFFMEGLKPYGVAVGAIGNFPGTKERGASFSGSPIDILGGKELTNGNFYIDNEKSYCLNDNEYIASGVPLLIDTDSGLLNTPVREDLYVLLETLFEPQAYIGQYIQLKSSTEKSLNGYYKVTSIHHKGIISDAVSGSLTSSLGLAGYKTFIPVELFGG